MEANENQKPVSPFKFPASEFVGTGAEYRKALKQAQAKFHKSPEGIAFASALTSYANAITARVQAEITPEQRAAAAADDAKEQARYNRCRAAGRRYYVSD